MTDDGTYGQFVKLPTFMVSYECGEAIKGAQFPAKRGYIVMVALGSRIDFFKYMIPFVAVVGVCFMVLLLSLVVKYFKERRRLARRRLPRRSLNKLPIRKYRKGAEMCETCAICLEDFEHNEKVRVLPCNHRE